MLPAPRCRGDFIVVGDIMKSVSLLMYKPEECSLELRTRDYQTGWTTGVEVREASSAQPPGGAVLGSRLARLAKKNLFVHRIII